MRSVLGRYGGRDLHLAMARRFWEEDRLSEARAAMEQALRAGFHPGDLYDLQRSIEAELGARLAGSRIRVDEHLLIEADPAMWGADWPAILRVVREAAVSVGDALGVRWGKPVLVTVVPDEDYVEFVHARFGYYRERAPWHKVCLPPSAVYPPSVLTRASRHEIAHAAAHQLAGDGHPRWLDEGIAVLMEGSLLADERRRYAIASNRGRRPALDEISARMEGYDLDLGSGAAGVCYAAAADFTRLMMDRAGWDGMARALRLMGQGMPPDKALRRAAGIDRRRLEREWLASSASP